MTGGSVTGGSETGATVGVAGACTWPGTGAGGAVSALGAVGAGAATGAAVGRRAARGLMTTLRRTLTARVGVDRGTGRVCVPVDVA